MNQWVKEWIGRSAVLFRFYAAHMPLEMRGHNLRSHHQHPQLHLHRIQQSVTYSLCAYAMQAFEAVRALPTIVSPAPAATFLSCTTGSIFIWYNTHTMSHNSNVAENAEDDKFSWGPDDGARLAGQVVMYERHVMSQLTTIKVIVTVTCALWCWWWQQRRIGESEGYIEIYRHWTLPLGPHSESHKMMRTLTFTLLLCAIRKEMAFSLKDQSELIQQTFLYCFLDNPDNLDLRWIRILSIIRTVFRSHGIQMNKLLL